MNQAQTPGAAIARATDAMRSEPLETAGWIDITASVMRRVSRIGRPGGSLRIGAEDDHGSRTSVTESVVRGLLQRALDTGSHHAEKIHLVTDDQRLVRIQIDLVLTYNTSGDNAAADARQAVLAICERVLDESDPLPPVDVRITDVEDPDSLAP